MSIKNLYIAQYVHSIRFGEPFRCFRLKDSIKYQPFCDDFGPMNLSCIARFIEAVDEELSTFPNSKNVLCVDDGQRSLTNAVFLLGAYMILKLDQTSSDAVKAFAWMDDSMIEPYRDATFSPPDFRLSIVDCWRGLERGKGHGWVRYAASGYEWGAIDLDEYEHYDHPANGDLQEVVPGKFVALKGPVALAGGAEYQDLDSGARVFSPAFYAGILRDMGVTDVVRLCAPRYPAAAFTSLGLLHHHLPFPDCACPPDAVAAAFLRIVDAAAGAVAVHCDAGLGRTGTLIALWLMRSGGFDARAAMGWLRIMRPGSVIGEQQRYLCDVDDALRLRRARAAAARVGGIGMVHGPDSLSRSMPPAASDDMCSSFAAGADGPSAAAGNGWHLKPAVLAAQVSLGTIRRARSAT